MGPIVYSDLRYYHIEPSDLDSIEPGPMELLGDGPWRMCGIGIDEPHVQMVYEDFFPGHEYRWTVWLDQIDLVTEGKAEIDRRPAARARADEDVHRRGAVPLPHPARVAHHVEATRRRPVPPHLDRLARTPASRSRTARACCGREPMAARSSDSRPSRTADRPRQRRRRSIR